MLPKIAHVYKVCYKTLIIKSLGVTVPKTVFNIELPEIENCRDI